MFELAKGPYSEVFVFDKYAVTVNSAKNIVNAVFYDKFRGVSVSDNFESAIYSELEFTKDTIENVAFWDISGKGDFQMFASIKTSGAITLHAFNSDIIPEGSNPSGAITR